jgi:hypothetical protein
VDRAVECYSAALSIRPNFPQSLNNLGVVLTAQVGDQRRTRPGHACAEQYAVASRSQPSGFSLVRSRGW